MISRGYIHASQRLFAKSEEEFLEKKKDLEERFGKDECKRMLSKVTIREGSYFYSTGDVLKKNDYFVVSKEGENLLPEVLFTGSGGLVSATKK